MFHEIEELTGSPLNQTDAQTILDWADVYGLSTNTITLLIADCMQRGKNNIAYWSRIALDFSVRHIFKYDEAQRYFEERNRRWAEIKQVLNCLGLYRNATMPEQKLFDKWKTEYAMSLEDILSGCEETVKYTRPTFQNLDIALTAKREGRAPQFPEPRARPAFEKRREQLESDYDYDFDAINERIFGDWDAINPGD